LENWYKLAKTDAIDAQILAYFGEAMQPQILAVESEESRQFGDLVSRPRQLVEMRTAEKSGLFSCAFFWLEILIFTATA
jgi:transposase